MSAPAPPPRIEGYRVLEFIGAGGMGTVWRAVQLSTRRHIALKLLHVPGVPAEQAQARFRREVELTSRLEHPNIARVYDSGSCGRSLFYSMELIDGLPVDEHVRRAGAKAPDVLRLIHTIGSAVEFAHARGVVHRDLKPSNILVDARGEPHILDFGLAKSLPECAADPAGDAGTSAALTLDGDLAGTPAFMSPEQVASARSDRRGDVFSLGVLAYLLLTGKIPYGPTPSLHELLKRVRAGHTIRPRAAAPWIDEDLEAVLLTAMEPDLERRYPSADAFVADIGRYLAGEPVHARRPTVYYFLHKWARRHGRPLGAAAALFLVLGATGWYVRSRLAEAAGVVRTSDRRAEVSRRDASLREAETLLGEAQELMNAGSWPEAKRRFRDSAARFRDGGRPSLAAAAGEQTATERSPDPIELTFAGATPVAAVRRRADEAEVVFADGALLRLDPRRPTSPRPPTPTPGGDPTSYVALSPSGAASAKVHVIEAGVRADRPGVTAASVVVAAGKPDPARFHGTASARVAIADDGRTIALAGTFRTLNHPTNSVLVFDLGASQLVDKVGETMQVRPSAVAISGDARLVVTGDPAGKLMRWPVGDRQAGTPFEAATRPAAAIVAIAFAPDGQSVLAADAGGGVACWEVASGKQRWRRNDHREPVTALAVSTDGRLVGSGDRSGDAFVYDAAGGTPRQAVQLDVPVTSLSASFPASGNHVTLLATTAGNRVAFWEATPTPAPVTWPFAIPPSRVAVSWSLGLIAPDAAGRLTRWPPEGPPVALAFPATPPPPPYLAVSHAARQPQLLALVGKDGELHLLNTGVEPTPSAPPPQPGGRTGSPPLPGFDRAARVAFSPDGELVAVTGSHGTYLAHVRDAAATAAHLDHATADLVQFSADARYLCTVAAGGSARVYETRTGKEAGVADLRAGYGGSVALSVQQVVASGQRDGSIRICHPADGLRGHTLPVAHDGVPQLCFAADGRTLISGGADGTIAFWDLSPGRAPARPVLRLDPQVGPIRLIAVAPDGDQLLVIGTDRALVRRFRGP